MASRSPSSWTWLDDTLAEFGPFLAEDVPFVDGPAAPWLDPVTGEPVPADAGATVSGERLLEPSVLDGQFVGPFDGWGEHAEPSEIAEIAEIAEMAELLAAAAPPSTDPDHATRGTDDLLDLPVHSGATTAMHELFSRAFGEAPGMIGDDAGIWDDVTEAAATSVFGFERVHLPGPVSLVDSSGDVVLPDVVLPDVVLPDVVIPEAPIPDEVDDLYDPVELDTGDGGDTGEPAPGEW